MNRVFFDHASTTPIDQEVIKVMMECMQQHFGNPSSIHKEGRTARTVIEQARKTVARLLNASIGEIFFTSGGTESNNMALKGAVRDLGVRRIISSPLEHHCVLHSLDAIASTQTVEIVLVRLDEKGLPDMKELEALLQQAEAPKTMVSLMHANNELGLMIDLPQVALLCQQYGALFHSDTVQTMGYFPFDLAATPVHFISAAAHKFYGPKGVGFIYINGDNAIKPLMDGGSQERNMRAGTENIHGIVGLAKALEMAYNELEERKAKTKAIRAYFLEKLQQTIPEIEVNGDPENGHYKVLSISFPPSPKADLLLLNLDMAGISVSGGSACSSGAETVSHVLATLIPDSLRKTIRFSFSHHNTFEEADYVVQKLSEILEPVSL
ncbi:MAG: cysteine desulfurase family protein [Saprospiraceae bacterium]